MSLNDTASDFKVTKSKRGKYVSNTKNKLSRNKKQKTDNEADEKGIQIMKNDYQINSKRGDTGLKSEVVIKSTSIYFSTEKSHPHGESNVSKDTAVSISVQSLSSSGLKLLPEPPVIKTESFNLPIKTEIKLPCTAENAVFAVSDCPQNVVSSGETVLHQKSQESLSVTSETTSEHGEEKWWCIFCDTNLTSVEREEHVKACVLQFEYKSSTKNVSCPPEKDCPSSFTCDVCKKDISHLSFQNRNEHINGCIDSQTTNNQRLPLVPHDLAPEAKTESISISECPVCGKQFTSLETRLIHIKKCCKTHKMEPQQVIIALQLQEKHALERIAIGLPPLQIKPSSLKSNVNPRQRKRKVPLQTHVKSDPDLQIAMALSLSLKEEEKRNREALGLLIEEPYSLALNNQESGSDRLPVELQPPSENQIPGRTKPRSRRNDPNKPVPVLLLRTEEERLKLLQERVSSIIAPMSPPKEIPEKSTALISKTSEEVAVSVGCSEPSGNLSHPENSTKLCMLWTLSGLAIEKDKYYVPEIQEWVSLSEVVTGSKLQSLSQLPGHKISHDLDFEYSTFYTQENQDLSLSQNCSAKPIVDIPSTQEMLDIITKDDTFISKIPPDAIEKSELDPSDCGGLYFGGEGKNDGFFSELLKNINQNVANPVIDCLRKLVGNSWMSDVSILVAEQRTIPAHKLLLMLRCPTITKELQESHNGILSLDWACTPIKAAMEFLHFVYTGFCQLSGSCKREIYQLFYRYDMVEAYETLKNVIEAPNERKGFPCDDVSSDADTDIDIFQGNHDSETSHNTAISQDKEIESHDVHQVPLRDVVIGRNYRDSGCASSSSKDTSLISDHEDTVAAIKQISSTTSPVGHYFSRHASSSTHNFEILRKNMHDSEFLSTDKSVSFLSRSSIQDGLFLQNTNRKRSLDENSGFNCSSQESKQLPLICDEDIKHLCSPTKSQCVIQSKAPKSNEKLCSSDQNCKISVSHEKIANVTEKSGYSFNELCSPKEFEKFPTVCDNDLILHVSPLKQDMFVTENCGSKILNVSGVRDSDILPDASQSGCSFLHKAGVENSPELFVCDSDEEGSTMHNLNDIPSKGNTIGVPHSTSSLTEMPFSHLPKVNTVFTQKSVSRSPDQEIIIMNEIPCRNSNISKSCVFKTSKLLISESESDCQDKCDHREMHNSAIKGVGKSMYNGYLPDLIIDNPQMSSSEALLSTPTSSKSNITFRKIKRKLSESVSPVKPYKLGTSFKKVKVDALKIDSSDVCALLNIEDKLYAEADKDTIFDRRNIKVNKTFDHDELLNTSTNKSKNSLLSNNKSFLALTAAAACDGDDSEVELEAICADDRNDLSDVWEGFDDDGFREGLAFGNCNITADDNIQLLTPLKRSRNRPPTPHPSSARRSAKKLTFVDEDVSPSTSPVPTFVKLGDVDSSPITMQPLGERIGRLDQRKKSCSRKVAKEKAADTTIKENKFTSKKEVCPVSPAGPPVVTSEVKTTVQSKMAPNYVVSSSPITPLPDFLKMMTPELKDQLRKYGIRALPRKKAVSLLTHIYDETHPWQVEAKPNSNSKESVAYDKSLPRCASTSPAKLSPMKSLQHCRKNNVVSSPQKPKECAKQKPSKIFKPPNKKKNKEVDNGKRSRVAKIGSGPQQNNHEEDEINVSSSQTSSLSETSDFPEESILNAVEDSDDEHITASQCVSLEERMNNYILSDKDLYAKILMYEPLNISDFQEQLKQHGIKVGQTKVMDFLDEKCITFTLPRSEKHQKKQQERNKRFRKRVLAKLSQKPNSQKS